MESYIKQLLINLSALIFVWFSSTQLNSFVAWAGLYIPVFWMFVFFPAMILSWEIGLVIAFISGLFFESQYPVFQGAIIPVFLILYLGLYYRRSRIFDLRYSVILVHASVVHIVLSVWLDLISFQRGSWGGFLRSLQDILSGELFLLVILPLAWLGITFINARDKKSGISA